MVNRTNLDRYLDRYQKSHRITLVGPLIAGSSRADEPIIFVDGGANVRKDKEGVVIGDGDSFDGKLDVVLNPEKDFSDLAFALENIPERFSDIVLQGFLGGRRDHELFNIGEAYHFLKSRSEPANLNFDDVIIGYSAGKWEFKRNGVFSVAVVEETQLSIIGDCKYQLSDKSTVSPLSSLGLSNEGYGTIYIEGDGPVFILFDNG